MKATDKNREKREQEFVFEYVRSACEDIEYGRVSVDPINIRQLVDSLVYRLKRMKAYHEIACIQHDCSRMMREGLEELSR